MSSYTIVPTPVVLPEKIESASVKIEGWYNRRRVYVDRAKNETYFQVTSEANECHRCSLCREKMEKVGWKTGYRFWELQGHYSLYQKLDGVPADLSRASLAAFLGLTLED